MIRHLYVHIPFCARICPYCAFYKELLDRPELPRFCQALLRELKQHAEVRPTLRRDGSHFAEVAGSPSSFDPTQCSANSASPKGAAGWKSVRRDVLPSTIYFGGGTPTALSTSHLQLLLEGFHAQLDLSRLTEWTMEANPGSVSPGKAALLRELGVNRISLGVQSWDDDLLDLLGREHNAAQAERSFQILRAAGFENINLDLMFGLPGQTIEQWRGTLHKTIALEPEHISAYCLTYEEDTEFFLRQARGELRQDTDADAELFELTMSMLQHAGYKQYEISNYAQPGFESAHNRGYWSGEDYLGIGPSAFSTIGLQRCQNVANYREYADRVLRDESAVSVVEQLTPEIKRSERIALSLRTRDGVSSSELDGFSKAISEFMSLGLLEQSNGKFVLTQRGKSLADSVAEEFV